MRNAVSKYVQLSANTPATVTLTGNHIIEVILISVNICHPVYFRADGTEAALHTSGNYFVAGLGQAQHIDIDDKQSVTVSILCEIAGYVNVIAVEAG